MFCSTTHTCTNQTHLIFFQMYLDYVVSYTAHSKKWLIFCKIILWWQTLLHLPIPPIENGSYMTSGKLNNNNSYIALYHVKIYKLAMLYIISCGAVHYYPEGWLGMSDVNLLSGISGLPFDSPFLSPLLFFLPSSLALSVLSFFC